MEAYELGEEAKVPEKLSIKSGIKIRHAIDTEYARVCRSPVDGLYIVPSFNDVYVWFGILFVRRGYYGGGIFRFTLKFPNDFPNTRTIPTVTFESYVFHPSISPKSPHILDLKKTFPDGFKKEKHNILNILIAVQRIFFSYEAELGSCSNPEAAILWKEHKDKFKALCEDCVNTSRAQVYDDPPHMEDANAIKLTPWDSSIHEAARERMMNFCGTQEKSSWWERSSGKQQGFSWIDTDRMLFMTEPKTLMEEDMPPSERDRVAFGIERLDLSGVSPEDEQESTSSRTNTKLSEGSDISLSSNGNSVVI
ncbi:unnamed protein product [Auanema sp. JU1783]|nr:unnamed protein product [Auanema sp. JU1783]